MSPWDEAVWRAIEGATVLQQVIEKREKPGWHTRWDRFASFLQCKTPRGLIIPCKNAGILFRESSAEERSDDGAEKREKREERREKMATSSIPCISTMSRGHLKEVMKIRWGHRNSRKLESLHFYGVP